LISFLVLLATVTVMIELREQRERMVEVSTRQEREQDTYQQI
jgi:hypothetical protein